MITLIRVTVALLAPLISLTAFSYGAEVSGNLSIKVVSPGATGCGTASSQVPAGYTSKTAASDEFGGTALDYSKWADLANPSLHPVSGGVLHMQYAPDGSNGGIIGTASNGSGNAPFYIETRVRWPAGQTAGNVTNWLWSYTPRWDLCPGDCAEIDVDQRFCGNQDINIWDWHGGGNTWDGAGYTGPVGCLSSAPRIGDGNWHILGVQVLVDGTVIFTTDGTVVSSGRVSDMIIATPNTTGTGGYHWVIGGNQTQYNFTIEMQVDYVRTYCPGCN